MERENGKYIKTRIRKINKNEMGENQKQKQNKNENEEE